MRKWTCCTAELHLHVCRSKQPLISLTFLHVPNTKPHAFCQISGHMKRILTLCTFSSCSKLARLEQLEELDLSGNRLRAVPTTILNCQRLHTLCAHSNCINTFPEVLQLPEIKVRQIYADSFLLQRSLRMLVFSQDTSTNIMLETKKI